MKIKRYFFPVCGISTFKRYFHCIMSAVRRARVSQRRNKPRNTQIAILRRFWRKLNVIYPVKDNSTFKPSFHCILHIKRSARVSQRRNKPRNTQIAINRRFCRNLNLIYPVKDNTTIKRSFPSILHAERSARVFPRRNKTGNTQIAMIRRFWRWLSVISLPFLIFRRLNALFTPFYKQNAVHAFSSCETSSETRKSQSFVDFDEN